MSNALATPKSSDILRALRAHVADVQAHSMRRFSTGAAHYVYEIMTDGEPIVVRMANREIANGIPGGVYWHKKLIPLGVPLPKMYGYDLDAPYPYMILERLGGRDLGSVYPSLTSAQKKTLAEQIAEIQDRVAKLPPATGYGYLESYTPKFAAKTWLSVLEWGLVRAQKNIAQAEIFDAGYIAHARKALATQEPYMTSVQPLPFLDDTTTKNVIVHEGRLSGIVDVDYVCFGDRLNVLALTQMALLAHGHDTEYVDYWAAYWQLTSAQIEMMNVYTLLHGVHFMGEVGQAFNKDVPEPVDDAYVARLEGVVSGLLADARQ